MPASEASVEAEEGSDGTAEDDEAGKEAGKEATLRARQEAENPGKLKILNPSSSVEDGEERGHQEVEVQIGRITVAVARQVIIY